MRQWPWGPLGSLQLYKSNYLILSLKLLLYLIIYRRQYYLRTDFTTQYLPTAKLPYLKLGRNIFINTNCQLALSQRECYDFQKPKLYKQTKGYSYTQALWNTSQTQDSLVGNLSALSINIPSGPRLSMYRLS